MVLSLSHVELAAASGNFDDAAAEFQRYRFVVSAAVGPPLRAAEPWSLFNPKIHDAHYGAMRQLQAADREQVRPLERFPIGRSEEALNFFMSGRIF